MSNKEDLIVQALGQKLGRDADFYTSDEVLLAAGFSNEEIQQMKEQVKDVVSNFLKGKVMDDKGR